MKKDPSRAPKEGSPKAQEPQAAPSVGWNLEQLKKTAASRGIPLEVLVARMVEQYLKEDKQS